MFLIRAVQALTAPVPMAQHQTALAVQALTEALQQTALRAEAATQMTAAQAQTAQQIQQLTHHIEKSPVL